jgi:ParB/RepB/Spo0J family partition protein
VDPLPELRHVPLGAIDIPARPPRRFLGDIPALADSMQEYGLQQPIGVRAVQDRYVLTSGLRRFEAARTLGWSSILAFVRTVSADDAYVLDLIENLQREDLSPEEEADALAELIRTRGWTLQQVADALKRSVGYVSKRVRIFEDPHLRDAVVNRGLPVSTAEEVLSADVELRPALIDRAISEGWDQVRTREALRAGAGSLQIVERSVVPETLAASDGSRSLARFPADPDEGEPARPRGFTRAVREFHRLIMSIQAVDLTESDRSALRALFRDLVMLARASSTPSNRVFPPLPSAGSRGRLKR